MTLRYGSFKRIDGSYPGSKAFDHSDLVEFKSFHNTMFKNTDASLEWLMWYLTRFDIEHKPIETRVYTLHDDDRLIGTWCVEPKKLAVKAGQYGPDTIDVGRCFSVGIHHDYQRRGLFMALSKHAIEEERRLGQYEYVVGFPQIGKPVIDAHLRSGWERVQAVEAWSYVPKKEIDQNSLKWTHVISEFDVRKTRRSYVGSFLETDWYRDVRWLQHPDCKYICIGSGTGYIVLKPYGSACHVLDVSGETDDVKQLLETAKTLTYRHRWQELTVWCAKNEALASEIEAAGFRTGATFCKPVEALAVRINAKAPLLLGSCHLQMCIEEIY